MYMEMISHRQPRPRWQSVAINFRRRLRFKLAATTDTDPVQKIDPENQDLPQQLVNGSRPTTVQTGKSEKQQRSDTPSDSQGQNQGSVPINSGNQSKKTNRQTVRDYLDRIPVVGIYNLTHAEGKKEELFWIMVLFLAAAGTFAYFIPSVLKFAEFKTVIEVKETEQVTSFPPVFLCVNSVNGTSTRDVLNKKVAELSKDPRLILLAKRFMPKFKTMGLEEAMWEFQAKAYNYMTSMPLQDMSPLANMTPALNEYLYRGILAYGSDWNGVKTLYDNAMMPCDSLIKKCWYNGQEFPCCPAGQKAYSRAVETCFKFEVNSLFNMEDRNVVNEQHQLILQTEIDTRYTRYPDGEVPNFSVGVENQMPALFSSVYGVPVESTAYVRVKRTRRYASDDCIQQYQYDPEKHQEAHVEIQEYFQSMTAKTDYTVERCFTAQLLETLSISCGCVVYYDTLKPNDSSICTAAHLYACYYQAFQSNVKISVPVQNSRSKRSAPVENTSGSKETKASQDVGGPKNSKNSEDVFTYLKRKAQECLPLCDTWNYELQVTYTPFPVESTINPGLAKTKIVITVDQAYQVETEILKIDQIAFVASIGDAVSVFLGLSLPGLLQAVYWLIGAYILKRKLRKQIPIPIRTGVAGSGQAMSKGVSQK